MCELPTPRRAGWLWPGVMAALVVLTYALLVPPGSLPYPPRSDYSDAAIAHWPNAYYFRESVLRHGQWPFWNPDRVLGQPFAANPLTKVWYPPQWLVLLFPPTLHLNLLIYAHAALAVCGVFAWAEEAGLSRRGAVFAAIAWALNPKLVAHLGTGHLDMLYALAWVPWLLWAVGRAVAWPDFWRGIQVAGVAAMLVLADLRIAFYMLPAGALYGLALAVRADQKHRVLSLIGMGAIAIAGAALLTAVQTVPLAAISADLTRVLITPSDAAIYSLPPRYLLGMLFADIGGFHEWMTYVGLPVLILAFVPMTRPPKRKVSLLLWGVIALAILWALGDNGPIFLPAVRLIRAAGWFRVPSRAWFVVILCLTILSAWGLDDLIRYGLGKTGRLIAAGLAFAGWMWGMAGSWLLPAIPGNISVAGWALLFTGAGVWLAGSDAEGLWHFGKWIDRRAIGAVILIGTQAVSLGQVDASLVEGRRLDEIDAHDQAIIAALGPDPGLVYSPSFDLIGPAAARAGIQTLHGVDPFQEQAHAELIARAAGVTYEGYSVVAPPLPEEADPAVALRDITPDYDLLWALGVQWIVSRFPLQDEALTLHEKVDDTFIYRLAPGQSSQFCCAGKLTEYQPVADWIGSGITGLTVVGLAAAGVVERRRRISPYKLSHL